MSPPNAPRFLRTWYHSHRPPLASRNVKLRRGYPTPSNQCWPGGVPFVFWNLGMQMIQQPSKITLLYANDYAYRQVRLNQPHPANVAPSWYGDSVKATP